jgi:putative CocE/NonD family hydrolase
MSQPQPAGRVARVVGAVHRKAFGLPPGGAPYTVERGLRVSTRDGAHLITDLYKPVGEAHGTVLIRTPYGRGLPESLFHGRAFADHGYQVVVQSVRGTGGSTGTFRPIVQEVDDAQDTVAWLRERPWFTGHLATIGGSYLGWAQWALLRDPPPELRAAVVLVGPHDFARAIRGTGSLALADFLGWSATVQVQGLRAMVAARRRVTAALHEPTASRAAAAALGDKGPWFAEWLAHPDLDDPFWTDYEAGSALAGTRIPVLLIGGWHDVFVDQTLEQFRLLDDHNDDVALTIGPWTHLETAVKAARVSDSESLAWLDQHVAGTGSARTDQVRVYVTGAEQWRTLPTWPPKSSDQTLGLQATGQLTEQPNATGGGVEFTYDPADPTPAVGGRHMSGKAGRQDNRRLERRDDVVTFTSAPLEHDLDVIGTPQLYVWLDSDRTQADVFIRLCEVDRRGRSWNVTESFSQFSPATEPRTIVLGSCAHRFRAGHRIRLQVSGGAYPRYARQDGPCHYTIVCSGASLTLPVSPASP